MPLYDDSPMLEVLLEAPLKLVPMYAVLAVLHQKSSDAMLGTCVVTCHQVAGALQHLGFGAAPVAATATVYRVVSMSGQQSVAWASDVGTAQEPPTVTAEGTTDGHMVVHAPSFWQMIDPSIVQDPSILAAAHRDPLYSIPAVVPVPAVLAGIEPVYAYDENVHVTWTLRPDWTRLLDGVLTFPDSEEAARRGATGLAHDTLALIRHLDEDRDFHALIGLYLHLGPLLDGRTQLPTI